MFLRWLLAFFLATAAAMGSLVVEDTMTVYDGTVDLSTDLIHVSERARGSVEGAVIQHDLLDDRVNAYFGMTGDDIKVSTGTSISRAGGRSVIVSGAKSVELSSYSVTETESFDSMIALSAVDATVKHNIIDIEKGKPTDAMRVTATGNVTLISNIHLSAEPIQSGDWLTCLDPPHLIPQGEPWDNGEC